MQQVPFPWRSVVKRTVKFCLTVLLSTWLVSLPPEHDVLLEKAPSLDHSEAQDSAFATVPGAAARLWLSSLVPLDPLLQGITDSA